MGKIFRVQAQTPVKTVPKRQEEGGEMQISTLMVQEAAGKWADSFAVQLYGDMALQSYQPGELVVAKLRFRAKPTGTDSIFQDVTTDEIVRMNMNVNNNYNVF